MAIRTHPSYATAHENLGDIYARLASQAYDKALQIDSSNSSAQNKLALIRDLMSTAGRPGKPASRSANPPGRSAVKPPRRPNPQPPPLPPRHPRRLRTRAGSGQAGRSTQTRCRQAGRDATAEVIAKAIACGPPPGRARTSRPTSAPMPATSRPRPANPRRLGCRAPEAHQQAGRHPGQRREPARQRRWRQRPRRSSASTTSRQRSRHQATRSCNGQA
jgi:hypothetical protein